MNTNPGSIEYEMGDRTIRRAFGHVQVTAGGIVKAYTVEGDPDKPSTELTLELGPAVPYVINRNGETDD